MHSRIGSLRPIKAPHLIRRWLPRSGDRSVHHHHAAAATRGLSIMSPSNQLHPSSPSKPYRRRPMISSSFHSTTNTFIAEETAPEQVPAEGREDEALHPTSIDYAYTPPLPLTEESQKKVDDLFEKILWLDMIEVHLLTQVVNEQLGIAWNQVDYSGGPIAVAGGGATQEEVVEEKLLKDLKLLGFDAKAKIKVIKEVRSIAGLGLKEAKEMVESAPKIIQKDLKPEKAGELKAQLEAVGAQIEIA